MKKWILLLAIPLLFFVFFDGCGCENNIKSVNTENNTFNGMVIMECVDFECAEKESKEVMTWASMIEKFDTPQYGIYYKTHDDSFEPMVIPWFKAKCWDESDYCHAVFFIDRGLKDYILRARYPSVHGFGNSPNSQYLVKKMEQIPNMNARDLFLIMLGKYRNVPDVNIIFEPGSEIWSFQEIKDNHEHEYIVDVILPNAETTLIEWFNNNIGKTFNITEPYIYKPSGVYLTIKANNEISCESYSIGVAGILNRLDSSELYCEDYVCKGTIYGDNVRFELIDYGDYLIIAFITLEEFSPRVFMNLKAIQSIQKALYPNVDNGDILNKEEFLSFFDEPLYTIQVTNAKDFNPLINAYWREGNDIVNSGNLSLEATGIYDHFDKYTVTNLKDVEPRVITYVLSSKIEAEKLFKLLGGAYVEVPNKVINFKKGSKIYKVEKSYDEISPVDNLEQDTTVYEWLNNSKNRIFLFNTNQYFYVAEGHNAEIRLYELTERGVEERLYKSKRVIDGGDSAALVAFENDKSIIFERRENGDVFLMFPKFYEENMGFVEQFYFNKEAAESIKEALYN